MSDASTHLVRSNDIQLSYYGVHEFCPIIIEQKNYNFFIAYCKLYDVQSIVNTV